MKPLRIPGLDTYFGGKSGAGVYQQIINRVRPCDTLIIPFAGNCGVTRHIKRPARVLLNDLDQRVTDAWSSARLDGVEVSHGDGVQFLSRTLQRPDLGRVVVYCDPPYLGASRRNPKAVYRHEMLDESSHRVFLDTVNLLNVDCLVSCYPHPLYAQQLAHWQRVEFTAQTRRGPATEWLFFNYPPPTVLHDDQYAGANYREREYVRRKEQRWLKKWEDLAPHEQQRLLSMILKTTPPALVQELVATTAGSVITTPTDTRS